MYCILNFHLYGPMYCNLHYFYGSMYCIMHLLLLWIHVLYCALVAEFFDLQNMETQGKVDNIEEKGDGSGHVTWNTTTSAFMLNYLAEMVSNGTKTTSGFKKVHLNMCAWAINDHFKSKYSGENAKNHLRTWQRRYAKIIRFRKLSGVGCDEDSCMITLDVEHYASYVAVCTFS
jgi:hypothetical protein